MADQDPSGRSTDRLSDAGHSRRRLFAVGAGAALAAAAPGAALPSAASAAADSGPGSGGTWVGTWATAPTAVPAVGVPVLQDQTVRQVVHTSIGGEPIRIRLTNEFGDEPLLIGEARIALRAAGGSGTDIVPRTDRRLTFSGRTSVAVPAGAPVISDAVPLRLPPAADLVISIYLPARTPVTTVHGFPFQDNVVAAGNVTGARTVTATATTGQWYFLSSVSVLTGARGAASIVALGDSITDGAVTETNANHRWPDLFAQRLRAAPGLAERGVLNLGIAGNRLLHDPNPPAGSEAEGFAALFGHSALRRFDRDVIAQAGVRFVVVLLGVNDLGHPGTVAPPTETVSAEEIIGAHRQLIARTHAARLRIFGATILPFKDDTLGFDNPVNERKRQQVNHWIRRGGEYDAVIDFDAAVRDPADPLRMRAEFDSGDHLHPNDAGMAAMAAAVPLRLFR
jgi:lysophospholipase L1-like esterase